MDVIYITQIEEFKQNNYSTGPWPLATPGSSHMAVPIQAPKVSWKALYLPWVTES
jgi:hypothetical protein